MSEELNRGIRDFSQYDTMETEELEHILRLDAEAPEGTESDTELLLYVMEVLASRRNNTNIAGNTAQKAWESFQKNYMPEEYLEIESKKESKRIATPWLRRMIAAAAVVSFIVFIPITAKAFGLESIWNVFAHWAKETFSFINGDNQDTREPSQDRRNETASLQELLADSNRDSSIVPAWIPEGYVLDNIEKDITPVLEIYRSYYVNGESELMIRVQIQTPTDDIYNSEIEGDVLEIYTASGIEYYFFKNVDHLQVIWKNNNYECSISGDLSIEQAKSMIDSIGKG